MFIRTVTMAFFTLLIMSCSTTSHHTDQSKQQILEGALGELSINYAQVFSHKQNYIGLEVPRVNSYIMDIYDDKVKGLGKKYCADYFTTAVWMVPMAGGEISALSDTIAKECGNEFVEQMDEFLKKDKEFEYVEVYHQPLHNRVLTFRNTVATTMQYSSQYESTN